MKIAGARSLQPGDHRVLLTGPRSAWTRLGLSPEKVDLVRRAFAREQEVVVLPASGGYVVVVDLGDPGDDAREHYRRLGADTTEAVNRHKLRALTVVDFSRRDAAADFTEGLALANYQFLKYRTNGEGRNTLERVRIASGSLKPRDLAALNVRVQAVYRTRDLVNEPLSYLTATRFASEIRKLGREAGFAVTVLDRRQIVAEGLGGLLAVNRGSTEPPTFSILEWKPDKPRNAQPVVLVGKGVVYDTGGLSLKPTKNAMDFMKCDMAGAAAIVGAVYAVARSGMPVHVVGLVPATDNRPGGNAYVPGDVIEMYGGRTVEVLNTDAEGRLLLADALTWAKRYRPGLVVDLATLTGSAAHAIGPHGIVGMGTAPAAVMKRLRAAGEEVHERVVEFPLWEEYADDIKSDIADVKNVGSGAAGAITAGKFLEQFTDYPWIHLDIAGPAWLPVPLGYRTRQGTGVGVRLLLRFLEGYRA